MIKCKNCYWYSPSQIDTEGECMVKPPAIRPASLSIEQQAIGYDGPDQYNYIRPMVDADDRCAEFKSF
jgi:hypothetical protein